MKLDIEAMRAAALAAGGDEWQQGRLLQTEQTRRWTATQAAEANHQEQLRVFAGFSAVDQGMSRTAIGVFNARQFAFFAAAANPAAVLALIDRLERAERNRDMWKGQCERQAEALRKQAASAKMGMEAAKANGAAMERSAKAMLAQSNPDALESERQANALLTEENERLQRELDAAREQCRAR